MSAIIMVPFGILFSAGAQLLIKKSAVFDFLTPPWILWIGAGLVSYGVSFVLYSFILKSLPISRVSPVMAVGVMIVVVLGGMFWGETLHFRQIAGILMGIGAILLLLIPGNA
ncbi:MAG: EamA family transporter [Spirochaetaceae bacterium]|nr:EamA family transporter [Spirochaetaceae bacterium]